MKVTPKWQCTITFISLPISFLGGWITCKNVKTKHVQVLPYSRRMTATLFTTVTYQKVYVWSNIFLMFLENRLFHEQKRIKFLYHRYSMYLISFKSNIKVNISKYKLKLLDWNNQLNFLDIWKCLQQYSCFL